MQGLGEWPIVRKRTLTGIEEATGSVRADSRAATLSGAHIEACRLLSAGTGAEPSIKSTLGTLTSTAEGAGDGVYVTQDIYVSIEQTVERYIIERRTLTGAE